MQDLTPELDPLDPLELLGTGDDVDRWLAQADLFVLSSLSEGVPVALLEAMAMGVPSVVTAVGGMPEVINCCGAGLLVPPHDPQALASAVLELASDRNRRQQLGAVARRCHEQHFFAERMADDYLRLYHSCLETRLSSACPRPL